MSARNRLQLNINAGLSSCYAEVYGWLSKKKGASYSSRANVILSRVASKPSIPTDMSLMVAACCSSTSSR
ncbi:hypothetical protein SISNIDRAFT_457545 [Sistotremastrum niveocremeum HHB9708]|uniref:Uncharacterized protein n=1 Tax=Sistotremastrum niveocremeum HHB9708 TaxID=1314777 RepID=A0A164RMH8_9AGAM|nr:hypothetical protein SISNIDRAFT_457545 [Sistotremastrum niveocremeum HHB9708]